MLGCQSTSFHDALATRHLLGRRWAPEFEAWLAGSGAIDEQGALGYDTPPAHFAALLGSGA
jgi:ethanolamine ammonia-lyase large subunit